MSRFLWFTVYFRPTQVTRLLFWPTFNSGLVRVAP